MKTNSEEKEITGKAQVKLRFHRNERSASNGAPVEKRKCCLLCEDDKQKKRLGAAGAGGCDLQKNKWQPVRAASHEVDMEIRGRATSRRNSWN